MAVELERLVVQLSADIKKYENALNRAQGLTTRQAKSIEGRFAKMNKGLTTSFMGVGKGLIGVFAGGALAREAVRFSDAATRIDNSLKIAGLSGAELEKVYSRLRDSATKNAAPLEALTELYGRAALVQKDLGISGEELLGFTDKIAVALRVSGKSAAESSGALLQLSQALGSGTVRAEEFNSILEGALPIAQAAAAGLKEAGGSVAKLRQLVVDGAISSEVFFRAFEAGAPILEEKVANATFTVAQATGNLGTALIDVAREFDKSTGAGEKFAGSINSVATAVSDFDVSGFIAKIRDAKSELQSFFDEINKSSIMEQFAEFVTGTDLTVGKPVAVETLQAQKDIGDLERQIKILQDRIEANKEMAIDTTEAQAQLDGLIAKANTLRAAVATGGAVDQESARNAVNRQVPFNPLGPLPTAPSQVSVKDFAPPASTKKGGTGGRGRRDRQDDLQREIEQIKERTAAIQAETAAMAGINPLIDDYGYAIEKARAKQDLLTAAQKAGIAVTPQLEAQIDSLAEGYANASVAAEQLAESQDKARQTAEEMRDLGKDVMGGFIHDLLDGKSAADALAGALGKIGDKLLDMAMNDMFGGGGSSGGFLSMLFGGGQSSFIPGILSGARVGLFHKGGTVGSGGSSTTVHPGVFAGAPRYHSGGIAGLKPDEVPAILQKGEVVLPRGTQSPSGGTTFAPVYHIDARGADAAAVARLESGLAKTNREMQARIESGVRSAQQRNVKLGR